MLEVKDFLIRLIGPVFYGKVNYLKLSWRIVIGISFLDSEAFPVNAS